MAVKILRKIFLKFRLPIGEVWLLRNLRRNLGMFLERELNMENKRFSVGKTFFFLDVELFKSIFVDKYVTFQKI